MERSTDDTRARLCRRCCLRPWQTQKRRTDPIWTGNLPLENNLLSWGDALKTLDIKLNALDTKVQSLDRLLQEQLGSERAENFGGGAESELFFKEDA